MKIGDKKADKVVQFTGEIKRDVLACFDLLTEQDEERALLELKQKQREVNEQAKKRF